MQTIPLEQAEGSGRNHRRHAPDEEIVLTDDGQACSDVTKAANFLAQPPETAGTIFWMAPDFDAPLEGFEDYVK